MLDWLAFMACGLLTCDQACRTITYEGRDYAACTFRVDEVVIRTHLYNENGEAYATLRTLERTLPGQPDMLMNGGMYHANLSPVGLYIESGKRQKHLSTRGGWGNFHLLPNGVFWVKNGKAHVTETRRFARRAPNPDFATQSGPMLVIGGTLHPRFLKQSDSLKIRNGVGVSGDGQRIVFAISKRPVSFYQFGTLFRDLFQTPDALFLDGTISSIRSRHYRRESWRALGPILSVTRKETDHRRQEID